MYGLMGKFVAQPDKRDALVKVLLNAAEAMRELDGLHLYVVSSDPNDETGVWVTEVWQTQADHQGSLELEAVQTLIAEGRPLIASMGDRIEFTPQGGKGLST